MWCGDGMSCHWLEMSAKRKGARFFLWEPWFGNRDKQRCFPFLLLKTSSMLCPENKFNPGQQGSARSLVSAVKEDEVQGASARPWLTSCYQVTHISLWCCPRVPVLGDSRDGAVLSRLNGNTHEAPCVRSETRLNESNLTTSSSEAGVLTVKGKRLFPVPSQFQILNFNFALKKETILWKTAQDILVFGRIFFEWSSS